MGELLRRSVGRYLLRSSGRHAPLLQVPARGPRWRLLSTEASSSPHVKRGVLTVDWGDQRRMFPTPKKKAIESLPLDVRHMQNMVINRRGHALYTQRFLPAKMEPKAFVFLCHDYADHSSWFLRELAVFLCQHGFGVIAMDYEGHGRSDGLHGYIPSFTCLVNDLCDFFGTLTLQHYEKKCFLLGEGLGGTLAMKTYLIQGGRFWDGVVLVSPVFTFPQRLKPPQFAISLLKSLESSLGTTPLIPYSGVFARWLREPSKQQELLENPLFYRKLMRLSTLLQILEATTDISHHFKDLIAPLLLLHGDCDMFSDKHLVTHLYHKSKSLDKTLKTYADMHHSLLGGEKEVNVDKVRDDLLQWLVERTEDTEDFPLPDTTAP